MKRRAAGPASSASVSTMAMPSNCASICGLDRPVRISCNARPLGVQVRNQLAFEPGDLVLGDDDGLVAVSVDHAESVFAAASEKHAAEETILAGIRAVVEFR